MFRTSIWTVFLINILPCHWCNYCMFRSQTFIHQCLFGRHTVHHTVLRTPHSSTYTTQFYVHHTVLLTPHSFTAFVKKKLNTFLLTHDSLLIKWQLYKNGNVKERTDYNDKISMYMFKIAKCVKKSIRFKTL